MIATLSSINDTGIKIANQLEGFRNTLNQRQLTKWINDSVNHDL